MRETGRIAALVVLVGGLLLALSAPSLAQEYWFERYQRVVTLLDQGNWKDAEPLLEQLLQEHPVPERAMRLPGSRVLDYRPYFQQARLLALKGDLPGAQHSLVVSVAFGEDAHSHQATKETKLLRARLLEMQAREAARPGRQQPRPASLRQRR